MINFYDTVVSYNKQAMIALKNNQVSVAFNLLNQAERILKRKNVQGVEGLMPLTLNNLGLFYKKTGDYCEAIKVLNKSILENRSENLTKANTYLNLSSVYSQLIDHEKALSASFQSLKILKFLKSSKPKPDDYNLILLSTYSSIATEQEHLSQYMMSEKYYKKALSVCKKYFPTENYFNSIQERYLILQGKLGTILVASDSFRTNKRTSFTPKPGIRRKHMESSHKYWESSLDRILETRESFGARKKNHQSSDVGRKFYMFSKGSKEEYWRAKGKKSGKSVQVRPKKKNFKRKKENLVAKTPDMVPVPFKSKLLLFNTVDNYS